MRLFSSAKEMNMIGHDDITPNSPAVTRASGAPLLHENPDCFILSEDSLSVTDAGGDVVDRKIDPNTSEPSQMFMHIAFVAEGVDLGEPKRLLRTWPPRSAPAG